MSPFRALPHRLAALLVLALSLTGLMVGPAAAGDPVPRPPGLTAHQGRVVLDLIDDICGDTWCEGDHAFEFRRFSCDPLARTCTLRLRIAPYTDAPLTWYSRTGQVRGFVRFREMVTTSSTGYRSLTPEFYSAVNDLIGRVEARVPLG